MTDAATGPVGLYCTGPDVAAFVGGSVASDNADALSCAYAATAAVWTVVADPGWTDVPDAPAGPVPEGVHRAALMVAAELYKAGAAPTGEFTIDPYVVASSRIGSNLVRKYGAALAPWARVGGMVG